MSRSTRWQWCSRFLGNPRQAAGHRAPAIAHSLRLEPLETRRLLAVFSVDNLDDSGPGSLRDAIVQANEADGPDEIDFRSFGTIELESQLPTITDALTVTGRGSDRTILDAGNGADGEFGTGDGFRIFDINNGDNDSTIEVFLSGLTLTGGDTRNGVPQSGFDGGPGEDGGAIRSSENLTIVDSVITGNAAGHGSDGELIKYCLTSTACQYGFYEYRALYPGDGGRGGGVWSEGGNLTITSSVISDNRAGNAGQPAPNDGYSISFYAKGGSGGGIGTDGGDLTITGSTVRGNLAGRVFGTVPPDGDGGGVFSTKGSVTLSRSLVEGNTSDGAGGGVGVVDSGLSVVSSTISGNFASFGGVEISVRNIIADETESLLINNSTISSGTLSDPGYGGTVYSAGADTIITQSTIVGEASNRTSIGLRNGSVRIDGSIITGGLQTDSTPGTTQVSHSLIGYSGLSTLVDGQDGNQVGTQQVPFDPQLAPLTDNGGPTPTHALLPGSPALERGDPIAVAGVDGVPEFDQRGEGYTRVAAGRIDIGAYESPPVLVVNNTGDLDDGDLTNGITTLREAINAANAGSFTTEIRFDLVLFGTPQTIAVDSQLPITNWLVITGPGADLLTLDAGNGGDGEFGTGDGHRIFDINDDDDDSTIDIFMSGLTLTGGDTRAGVLEDGNNGISFGEDGGAIRSSENLTIVDSIVTGNATGDGSDGQLLMWCTTSTACGYEPYGFDNYYLVPAGNGGRGGGVWVENANLTISRSTISGNRTGEGGELASPPPRRPYLYNSTRLGLSGSGGGLGIRSGNLTISGSTISGNATGTSNANFGDLFTGSGIGGGVYAAGYDSRLSVANTTISGNTSIKGGGAGVIYSSATLQNSTISGNEATNEGGGVQTSTFSGRLELNGVTVSGNRVRLQGFNYGGGGIHSGSYETILTDSTITANTAQFSGGVQLSGGTARFERSVISGNNGDDVSRNGFDWDNLDSTYSLVGVTDSPALVDGENGNQVGTLESPIDPRLAPLADNGGPTLTHALLSDSPALNAGNPEAVAGADGVPLYDQRGEGFSRVLDGRIDIGAFEGFVVDLLATSGDFNADGVVDALDNEAWRASYGATVDPYTGADANGNGRIDAGDYTVWRDNFTPRDVEILQTAVVPIIDGTPDPLWGSVPAQGIGNLVFGSVDSPNDASATWRAVWDETALYFYAGITDQRLIRDSSFAFEDDGLEVFFDADLSRQATYDGVDDTQYMFRLADSLPVGSPDSPADATEGVVYATGSNPNGGGYTIEVAIPWAALKAANPLAGDLFGLEFAMQDDDDGGGINSNGADGRLQWHGTSNQAFRRPSAFGVAALSPRLAQPPVASLLASESPETQPAKSIANFDEGFAVLEPVRPRFRTPAREPMKDRLADVNQGDLLLIALTGGAGEEALELDDKSQRTPKGAEADDAFDAAFAASVR